MSRISISPNGRHRGRSALLRKSWVKWTIILGGCAAVSLLLAPEVYLYFLYKGERIPFAQAAALTGANTLLAAAFAPAIVWLTRRFPLEQGTWIQSLPVHTLACLVFSISHSSLYALLCYASPQFFHILFIRFHPNLITYWAIVGFTEAIDYFEKYQERERQLAQAHLELLKNQLHPHFLFNTLHAVSAMMHEDVKAADQMVSRLSDLLRLMLDNIGHHEVTLKEEIDFLQRYLEVERLRFQERLALTVDVEPETLDALVPSMVLQPLVENSIRHGFGTHLNRGTITIQARREAGWLILRVIDNGCGLPKGSSQPLREGLGLRNTRQRLEQLYAQSHRLQLETPSAGGAILTLQIPFHSATVEEAGASVELKTDEDSSAGRRRRALGAKADPRTAQS